MAYNLSNCLKFTLQSFTTYFLCAFQINATTIVFELNFRTKPQQTCNHRVWLRSSGSSSFHPPSCGSWGQKEWQKPSRTGRTCTSCGRRAPPGCGRWACPSSWRWRHTGHTWMFSHLQQGKDEHLQEPQLLLNVWTQSHHAQQEGTQFHQGYCVGR